MPIHQSQHSSLVYTKLVFANGSRENRSCVFIQLFYSNFSKSIFARTVREYDCIIVGCLCTLNLFDDSKLSTTKHIFLSTQIFELLRVYINTATVIQRILILGLSYYFIL